MKCIGQDRMVLLSSAGGAVNGMTVAWGGFGVMLGEPCIFFAVRPSRFTYQLTEAGVDVSLCTLSKEHAGALTYLGTRSGRDGDKLSAVGLSPLRMPCGGYGIAEARLVITARKIYSHAMMSEEIHDPALVSKWYSREGLHKLYIAAVKRIYLAE